MSFPRYPEYKDSGVPWLGKVPLEWAVKQGRRVFRQIREAAQTSDVQLSSTQKYGVVPQSLFMELEDQKVALALAGVTNFKHVEQDDFVISLRSFQGGIERSKYKGCVSPAYTVLRRSCAIDASFMAFVLKSPGYISALQAVTDGIRDGKNISYEQFGEIELPLPSQREQSDIATFLDRETAKIDALAAEHEKLVALLQEKRQAVISHAVTKGLDPNVPMKDSDVEWLGEVPAHWGVLAAKRVSKVFVPQRNKPELNTDQDGVAWVTTEHMNNEEVHVTDLWVSASAAKDAGSRVLKAGAVIASCVGTFGIAAINTSDVIINQQLQAYIPGKRLDAKFLRHYVMNSACYFEMIGTAATIVYVNQFGFENMPLALPPYEEQGAIIEHIAQHTAKLDTLIAQARTTITLLQERRTALISAAVTGQIDVRGIAS